LVERGSYKPNVVGSSPSWYNTLPQNTHLVEIFNSM
jgi:hypothetical protein